ncbi:MAG TPA: alginate lyase family protein [Terriglobia bacterium]|nr:alginate lyase family protein [Terriglobia bacterium]
MSPPSIVREKAAKLATMSWDEIRTRLRQEINKRRDAVIWRVGVGSVASEIKGGRGRASDGHSSLQPSPLTGAALSPPRFFFAPRDLAAILKVLRERLPNRAQNILDHAERACRHQFDLLGYKNIDYGKVIDWHLDAVNGKRAPHKVWYKIPFLDFSIAGDHKVVWELNRHQHLVTLAKAYLLTREDRFALELLRQWQHWRKENRYPMGINWASSLEVGFRTLSWIWVSQLLGFASGGLKQFQSDLLEGLALNGRHLERYLSIYWSPNTHLLGEGVALFFVGTLYPALESAPRWRELGWRTVIEQAERQVERDGTHFERSVYYHVYALDFFLHARLLAGANGISVPGTLDRTIQKMMEFLLGLGQAGPVPRFGDDDGGRVFDPQRNNGRSLLDPLSLGAVLFDRADFKSASPGLTEEALWLLGPGSADRFDATPSVVPAANSRSFPAGGFYVMANSEIALAGENRDSPQTADAVMLMVHDESRRQMVVRAGPLGAGNCGHGHADALSVHLAAGGEEWLVDPGTFKYVSSEPDRATFRATAAHNTLQVDGLSQAEPRGPFTWQLLPKVRVDHWIRGEAFDLFEGSHNGYERLQQPVTHRRWIFHLKRDFWLIRDIAEGVGEHQLDLSWHFGPGLVPSYTPPGFTLAPTPSSGPRGFYEGILILPCEGHGWSQQIERGRVSPVYGVEEPAAVLRFSTRTYVPSELAVVLNLLTETSSNTGRLTSLPVPDGRVARGLQYERADTLDFFLFGEGGADWRMGPWRSDAHFIFGSAGRQHLALALCAGSYLEVGGERLVACQDPIERYELRFAGGERTVFSSDSDTAVTCDFDALATAIAGGPPSFHVR